MNYPAGCPQPIKELSCRISTVYQWMVLQYLHNLSMNYLAGFQQPMNGFSCRISIESPLHWLTIAYSQS
jgi:hypothetical protein